MTCCLSIRYGLSYCEGVNSATFFACIVDTQDVGSEVIIVVG